MMKDRPYIDVKNGEAWLRLHVQPNAKKTEITGIYGNLLKIRLKAPPVDGKANKELERFLTSFFGVKKSDVMLISGLSGRKKVVKIIGFAEKDLRKLPLA